MANVHTVDLVNRILPNVGDTISVEDYRAKLEELGYDTCLLYTSPSPRD